MAQNPNAYAASHLWILALSWLWFLLHICPQQLSESLNARVTAVISTSLQTLARVLPIGSLCNTLSGTKSMQREHCASWRFQLGLIAQCWLTVRTWVYALVLLCSKAWGLLFGSYGHQCCHKWMWNQAVTILGDFFPWQCKSHGVQPEAGLEQRLLSCASR